IVRASAEERDEGDLVARANLVRKRSEPTEFDLPNARELDDVFGDAPIDRRLDAGPLLEIPVLPPREACEIAEAIPENAGGVANRRSDAEARGQDPLRGAESVAQVLADALAGVVVEPIARGGPIAGQARGESASVVAETEPVEALASTMRRLAKGRNGIRRDTDAKVEAELVRILTCVEEERSASEVRRQIRRRRLRDRHAREQRGREEIQGKCRQVRLRAGDGDAVQERRVVPTAEPSNDQVLAVHDRGP